MKSAHKASTKRTYTSGQKRYLDFCELYNLKSLPADESTVLYFIAYLFDMGLKCSTIRVYLSSVRSLHIFEGHPIPVRTPKIQLALRGAEVLSEPPSRKLPITFSILFDMCTKLVGWQDAEMLRVAMCTAFFGCLRSGEICLQDGQNFDPAIHLTVGDVSIDNQKQYLSLFLKRSKTDKFNNGVHVYIGCSGSKCCAFCLMKKFLTKRALAAPSEPLFIDQLGNVLKRSYFVSVTRLLLAMLNLDSSKFSAHSYRAGSATSASNVGLNRWEIKMLGRWQSEAYEVYLRNPTIVATFASKLAKSVD